MNNKMSKILFTAIISIVLLYSCGTGKSKDNEKPVVYFTETSPVIDGEFSEYTELSGSRTLVSVWGEHNPEDAEGFFVLLSDGESLYIYCDITDDNPKENNYASSLSWQGDSVALFIGTATESHSNFVEGDNHIRISPRSKEDISDFDMVINQTASADIADVAFVFNDTGYQMEAKIPLSALNINSLEPGQNIRCDFQVNDADEGIRDRILHWKAEGDTPWQDASVWDDAQVVNLK